MFNVQWETEDGQSGVIATDVADQNEAIEMAQQHHDDNSAHNAYVTDQTQNDAVIWESGAQP